uniref:Retrotransposon protein, putative, unclassified n=1 Tax=Oryza sativa subsp. japonica TaxID=39947 RepID=Q2R6U9_ORYSJ|nr:retrotransposon protein, putative, unclassified [Oryza sativa Japonica Group]
MSGDKQASKSTDPQNKPPNPLGAEVHEGNIISITLDKLSAEHRQELEQMMSSVKDKLMNSFKEIRQRTIVQKYKLKVVAADEVGSSSAQGGKGIAGEPGDKGSGFQVGMVEDLGPDSSGLQPQFNNFQDRIDYAVQHALINQSGVLVNTLTNMVKTVVDGTIAEHQATGPVYLPGSNLGLYRHTGNLYRHPYPEWFERVPLPARYKVPDISNFSGQDNVSTYEHVNRFLAQCGEASAVDALRVRLFPFSLSGLAFTWFSSLPYNSVNGWADLEKQFHSYFYNGIHEMKLSDLTAIRQRHDESVQDYIQRFRETRNRCYSLALTDSQLADLAFQGLIAPIKEKFPSQEFESLSHLAQKVTLHEQRFAEAKKSLKKINHVYPYMYVSEDDDDSEVVAAELVRSKKVVPCPWVRSSGKEERFDFDITKVAIEGEKIKFDDSKKPMKVDGNPFPVNMVYTSGRATDGGKNRNIQMNSARIINKYQRKYDKQQQERYYGEDDGGFDTHWDCEFFRSCWNERMRLPSIEDCPGCSDVAESSSRSYNEAIARQADVDEVEEAYAKLVLSPEQAIFETPEGTENRHLKPLYINGYVNGKPMSKMMVDGGVAVNLMPYATFRKLGRNSDDLIKTNMVLEDFGGNPSETKGVLNVELTVGSKTVPTTFCHRWEGQLKTESPNYYFEGVMEGSNVYTKDTVDDLDDKQGQGFMSADDLEEIDIGPGDRLRPTFISKNLSPEFRTKLIELLKEYRDCFAWEYYEMPGLSRSIVEHRLPIKWGVRPYQQSPRRCKADMLEAVKSEVKRLYDASFIRPCRYPEWVSNIVPVIKKNGKVRVCIDFRDLNKATPKDEYPMPVADQLVDAASGHKILSFMDGNAGYNQIFMAEEDIHKTAFRCPGAIGLFEWVVMIFGFKSAGATYQRAMNYIFHDLISWLVEVYIDDVVIKSKEIENHIADLRKVFERTRKYGLKMNPTKCAFGVSAGQFLGFLVHERGIEVTQRSINAIKKIQPPKDKTKLQELIGKINFVRRFISNLSGILEHFTPLLRLKADQEFTWGAEQQKALDNIKEYLSSPPVLIPPQKGIPFRLYLSAVCTHSCGIGLVIISPQGASFEFAYTIKPYATNNQAEYEPVLKGLQLLKEVEADAVEIMGDSLLMISQLAGEYECKNDTLMVYNEKRRELMDGFRLVTLKHVSREQNVEANDLAQGASGYKPMMKDVKIEVATITADDWRYDVFQYLQNPSQSASQKLRYRALKYTLLDDELYYRTIDGVLLKCLSPDQAKVVMGEKFGAIQRAPTLAMNPIIKPRPFRGWGIDMIGMINPPSSKGHKFILVATDYFTKWVEAIPLKKVDSGDAIQFVQEHIIYRFGIPQTITTDQGSIFVSDEFVQFTNSTGIKLLNSSPYYAQANVQAEASNKSLIKLIKRKISDYPRRWHTRLAEALWSYRMACHGSIQVPPYKLVYGHEAVLPWEIRIGSRRTELQNELTANEYYSLMADEREDLVQSRLRALAKVTKDKEHIARHYNKKVVPKSFSECELVWKLILPIGTRDNKFGKWSPNWEGPFQIHKVVSKGAYMLQGLDGEVYGRALNGKYLKKYYLSVWVNA